MIRNRQMNWLQRWFYGVRWREASRSCVRCNESGEELTDPLFNCKKCKGTGIERREFADTGAFDEELTHDGWKVIVHGLFYQVNDKMTEGNKSKEKQNENR